MMRMKKMLAFLLVAAMIVSAVPWGGLVDMVLPVVKANAAGDNMPCVTIANADELCALASEVNNGNNFSGCVVTLLADIDLSDKVWEPIGYNFNHYFAGIFDGNGHTIYNLKTGIQINAANIINKPVHTVGLFGICNGATIRNIVLERPYFSIINESGYQNDYSSIDGTCVYAGGVCGYANGTSITNVVVKNVQISAYTGAEAGNAYAGGIAGYVRNGCNLSYCTVQSGTISGTSNSSMADCAAGGLVGEMHNEGNISRCANYATVNGGHSIAAAYTGGICGKTSNNSTTLSWIFDCYNRGNVQHTGSWLESGFLGGIVGCSYSSVVRCYSSGAISANTNTVGGGVQVAGISGGGVSSAVVEACASVCSSISGGTSRYTIAAAGNKSNNVALTGISGSPANDANGRYEYSKFTNASLYVTQLGWDFTSVWQQQSGELPTLMPMIEDNAQDLAFVRDAINDLRIIYAEGETYATVKSDISFGEVDDPVEVTWSSDNITVIANDGTVTRQSEEVQVRITATVSCGNCSMSKIFVLNVLGTSDGGYTEAQDWGMTYDDARTLLAMMRRCKIKDIDSNDPYVQILVGNNTDEDVLASFMAEFMMYLEVPGESAFLKNQMGDVLQLLKDERGEEFKSLVKDFSDKLVTEDGVSPKEVARKIIAIPYTYYSEATFSVIGAYDAIVAAGDFMTDESDTVYENAKNKMTALGKILNYINKASGSSFKPSKVVENTCSCIEMLEGFMAYKIAKQNAAKSYIRQYLDLREKYDKDSPEFRLFMDAKAVTSIVSDIEKIDEFCELLYSVYDKVTYRVDEQYKVIVKCPVEVHVYDQSGKIVGRVVDNKVDHSIRNALFITVGGENNDEKTIYIQDDETYSVKMIGSDTGSMEVEVVKGNTSYTYENIPLEPDKEMMLEVSSDRIQQEEKGDIVLLNEGIYTENAEVVDNRTDLYSLKIYVCEETVFGDISLYNFGIQPVDIQVEAGVDISGALSLTADCSLVGYYTDISCTNAFEGTMMPDADLTLYAKCIRTDDRITVDQHPQDIECTIGAENIVLTMDLSASVEYSIQWYKRVGDTESVAVEGGNGSALKIDTTTEQDAYYFAVIEIAGEAVFVRTNAARVVVRKQIVTDSGKCGDSLTWELIENEALVISGTGAMYSYDSGSAPWSKYAAQITSVTLMDGITSISEFALENLSLLETVTVPNTVTYIEEAAFAGCEALKEMTLPFVGSSRTASDTYDAVFGHIFGRSNSGTEQYHRLENEKLYYYVYAIPVSLTKVTLTDEQIIPFGAFHNCENLTEIMLNDGIQSIGGYAFANCSITQMIIPDSVRTIGEKALSGCVSLETLTVPFVGSSRNAAGTYDAVFGHIFGRANEGTVQYFSLNNGSLSGYRYAITNSLKNVIVTDDPSLALGAFSNCTMLHTVELMQTTAAIDNCAFYGVSELDKLIIQNEKCDIYNSSHCIGLAGTIYGHPGSTAETFARSYSIDFVPIIHIHTGGTATCKELAKCQDCGEYFGEYDDQNHTNVVIDEAVPATCTGTGLTQGSHCEDCGNILVPQNITEKIGHRYETEVIQPSCTEEGHTIYTCACGDRYIADRVEPTGHSYEEGCCTVCGDKDPEYKEVVVPMLTLKSPTLEFKDTICIVAFYTAENIQDVVQMGMLTYNFETEVANIADADHVIEGSAYDQNSGRYYASSHGIHAKYLGDEVYLAIYAKLKDGTYAYSKVAHYSAVTYAANQLSKSKDTELKQLVAAMLNYGAQAQLYFGHNISSLANAVMTVEQKALPAAYDPGMVSPVSAVSSFMQGSFANNSGFSNRRPAISFEGAFCINYFFTPKYVPDNGITLYYWNASAFEATSVLTTDNATGSMMLEGTGTGDYRGDITGISAKQLSEAVYVAAVYENGGTTWTSGVLGYSIGAYCSSQAAKGEAVAELAKATAVYGYYAMCYFN